MLESSLTPKVPFGGEVRLKYKIFNMFRFETLPKHMHLFAFVKLATINYNS